jgi:1,2-diacylglycerol 3-beta-galactosyltransferase
VEENRVGIVVRGFREVVKAVTQLLEGGRLEDYRRNAAAIRNRAVYEVPEIMAKVMELGPAAKQIEAQAAAGSARAGSQRHR